MKEKFFKHFTVSESALRKYNISFRRLRNHSAEIFYPRVNFRHNVISLHNTIDLTEDL